MPRMRTSGMGVRLSEGSSTTAHAAAIIGVSMSASMGASIEASPNPDGDVAI